MFHRHPHFAPGIIKPPSGGDYTTGLTHYWPMTDAQVAGTVINDVVGTGTLNGQANGGIASVAGPNATYPQGRSSDNVVGTCITFASNIFNPNSAPGFSVAFWVYVVNIAALSGDTANGQQFVYVDIAGDGSNYFEIHNPASGTAGRLILATSQTRWGSTVAQLSNNTWAHVLITNSGGGASGTQLTYVNGSLAGLTTIASGNNSYNNIGSCLMAANVVNGVMNGRMAGVRTYNRALTALDASALFTAGG